MLRIVLLLSGLLLTASGAYAQPAKEQAKAFFLKGREHYAAARFEQALEAFEKANELTPHPLMLFNIGQVYESMGDLPNAADTFERYLTTNPSDAGEVKQRVARLQDEMQSYATIELKTEPPGALVKLGEGKLRPRGKTPLTFKTPAGSTKLVLELDGYQTIERPLKLKPAEVHALTVAMPPVLPTLVVRTTPPGADVRVDGSAPLGTTPFTVGLPAGEHKVRIEKRGFGAQEQTVTMEAGHTAARPLTLDLTLSEAAPTGTLEIKVSVDGAEVMVDERLIGLSPLIAPLELDEGLHKLQVTLKGSEPYEEMVSVMQGQLTRTSVELSVAGGGGLNGKTTGFVVMGVGGAVLLGAAVTGTMAFTKSGELDDCRGDASCERTDQEVELADAVRTRALTTDILLVSGLVAAGAGLTLYLLSDEDEGGQGASRGPSIAISPLDDRGAAAVGAFEF